MQAITPSPDFFTKYNNQIENASFYKPKQHNLTVYTGFTDKENCSSYILKVKEKLEVFKADCRNPFDAIKNIEGKHSSESYELLKWDDLYGDIQSKFLGA